MTLVSDMTKNYVVRHSGNSEEEIHKDVRAVVEPSGALVLYKVNTTGKEYLFRAYPARTWDDIRQQ